MPDGIFKIIWILKYDRNILSTKKYQEDIPTHPNKDKKKIS